MIRQNLSSSKRIVCAEVEVAGVKKPRFEFIGENTSAENSQNEENSQEIQFKTKIFKSFG